MSQSRLARRAGLLVLAVGMLFAGRLGAASAGDAKESKDAVKITATAGKPDADGKQTVTIAVDIDRGWHLYANPVKNEDMVNSQTVVKFLPGAKLEDVQIKYPEGKEKKDADVGNYQIYEGKVEITANVRRAKGDTSPLEVSVQISACDEKKCLMPSTVKIKVEQK
jgi:DsbC/DsbD-like thiol-disulfide interchange protein